MHPSHAPLHPSYSYIPLHLKRPLAPRSQVRAHLASRMDEQATERAQARAALRDRAATLTTPVSSKVTTPSASHAPSPPAQRPHQRAAVTPSEKLRRWRRDE